MVWGCLGLRAYGLGPEVRGIGILGFEGTPQRLSTGLCRVLQGFNAIFGLQCFISVL